MLWSDRPSRAVRRSCVIGYWIAIYSLTHWPEIDRFVPGARWMPPNSDKLVHACIYGGWTVMWWWLLAGNGRRIGQAAIGWIIVGGVAYGIFDETTQAIVARTPDILDWTCDMVGIALASTVLYAWQKRQHHLGSFTT